MCEELSWEKRKLAPRKCRAMGERAAGGELLPFGDVFLLFVPLEHLSLREAVSSCVSCSA